MRLSQDDRLAPLDPGWRVMDRVLREGNPRDIAAVIVGGRVVIQDGSFTMIDEPELLRKIRAYADSVDRQVVRERRDLVRQLEEAVEMYYRERDEERDHEI